VTGETTVDKATPEGLMKLMTLEKDATPPSKKKEHQKS